MTLRNSPDSALGRCSLLLCLTLSSCLLVTASRLQPFSTTKLDSQRPILQKDLVDKINNLQAGWQAALSSRFQNHTVQDFKRLCGALKAPVNGLDTPIKRISHPRDLVLPKNFDAREAWPHCSSINTILDQGHCGSCWAFGAVESLTDRFCINLNEEVFLSENDVLACCSQCGYGCDGGYPYNAWRYFEHTGVVTAQCDPYFDDKGCNHPGCEPAYPTPQCNKQCINNEPWNISKHFSINAYMVGPDVHDIMAEIYKNGPVEVAYDVYEDFAHYKSGVYKHLYGDGIGGHAVKLIGWGTTPEGTDYWIVANSWNRSWGEDGYFKILRGVDECGIESEVVAGMPHSKFARHASQ